MFPFLDPAPKRRRNTNPHNSVRRNLPRTPPPTPHSRTDRVGLDSRSSRRIPSWVLARRRDAWSLIFWGYRGLDFFVSRLTRPSARLYDCRGWWWGVLGRVHLGPLTRRLVVGHVRVGVLLVCGSVGRSWFFLLGCVVGSIPRGGCCC